MNNPDSTDGKPIALTGVVLDAPDARVLADFYNRLLGWPIDDYLAGWSTVKDPSGGTQLSFQGEPNYSPPIWPTNPNSQQMMVHLDFNVADLEAAHAHAIAVGATPTSWQPQSHVRVYTDPVGHVFCLAS
jgi:predicted enzyme related to lactoylglutathione lyase